MEAQRWQDWMTWAFSPSISAIFVTFLIAITLPLLLHTHLYRSRTSIQLPTFLLVGPSGSGKTSLLTLFERGKPAQTHTSQAPLTVEVDLPVSTTAASNRFRSAHDPTNQVTKKFLLADTPGHGKLRHHALSSIVKPQHLKGVIFVVDAATLSGDAADDSAALTETAQYLHDILLALQNSYTSAKSSRGPAEMPVLVAANKLDLFTALPAILVQKALESEISRLRSSRAKGLLDSGIGIDEDVVREQEVLGGGGEGKFEFRLMEEYNIPVEVAGGNVVGADGGSDTAKWWDWIGRHL